MHMPCLLSDNSVGYQVESAFCALAINLGSTANDEILEPLFWRPSGRNRHSPGAPRAGDTGMRRLQSAMDTLLQQAAGE